MLFETHLKPDLAWTRESIGNFNETQVPRDVEVNVYIEGYAGLVCHKCAKKNFEFLLNSDLLALLITLFSIIYLKGFYYIIHMYNAHAYIMYTRTSWKFSRKV